MTKKLCQILGIAKGVENKAMARVTELHKATQKAGLFDGFTKKYTPKDEAGDQIPPETKLVQAKVKPIITEARTALNELFDVAAMRDWGNLTATADVILDDGTKVLDKVPATYLLWLTHQLDHLHTFVEKLPTLDPAEMWEWDETTSQFKSAPVRTMRTQKVEEALMLAPPTDKHPAQTKSITVDRSVGTWETVKMSGAIKESEQREMLRRVRELQKAVKSALEDANTTQVEDRRGTGGKVLSYLFG